MPASSRFSRLLAFLFSFGASPKPPSIVSAEVSFELYPGWRTLFMPPNVIHSPDIRKKQTLSDSREDLLVFLVVI